MSSVTVHYTASDGGDNGLGYDPTDTRIISVSRPLCQKVKTFHTGADSAAGYVVHLYSLSSPPTLTGRETFSVKNQQPAFLVTRKYQYFMPSGSKFTMSACLVNFSEPLVTYYIIKGAKNYDKWKGNKAHHFDYQLDITTGCGTGNDTYSYSVQSDDFYYLTFDSEVSYGGVNISMYFERPRYEVDNSTVLDKCRIISSYSYESCGVGLPLSGTTNLLTVEPKDYKMDDVDWTDVVFVNISCSARIWMYAVISLAVLVGIVGILSVFTVLFCCLCKHKKKHKQTGLPPVAGTENDSVNTPLIKGPSSSPKSASSGYATIFSSTPYKE